VNFPINIHADLKPTNELLERQAVALERIAVVLERLVEIPAEPPSKPKKISAKDIGSYGDENESEERLEDRLKRQNLRPEEIEKAIVHGMFGSEDEP